MHGWKKALVEAPKIFADHLDKADPQSEAHRGVDCFKLGGMCHIEEPSADRKRQNCSSPGSYTGDYTPGSLQTFHNSRFVIAGCID
jgi:hypothetical protein